MKPYRKPDQEYYDDYDRHTIQQLKEILAREVKNSVIRVDTNGNPITSPEFMYPEFIANGIKRAKNREVIVKQQMRADEEKDDLVASYRIPNGIKCDTCGTRMLLSGHTFGLKGYKLLFIFDCPKQTHNSRKMIHPNGDPVFFPKPTCKGCGGSLISASSVNAYITTVTEVCTLCGDETIDEFDMTPPQPITEEDRKIFCTQFTGKNTFQEDLIAIFDFLDCVDINEVLKDEKSHYEVNKIERLSILKVKDRLSKVCEEHGYIELGFEKPTIHRYVSVKFDVQDSRDRESRESQKSLARIIVESLFTTNWRLEKSSIRYRMGLLTGKVRGSEDPEILLQLAKEIKQKSSAKQPKQA